MEQIGLTLEVSEPGRGLGTNDGDPDEFNRCRQSLVASVDAAFLQVLPDPCQFGGEVTERVGWVNVLDDQIQPVEWVEAGFCQAENLDVALENPSGGSLELGCDRIGSVPPDDSFRLGESITPLVTLSQGEVEVAVLAT